MSVIEPKDELATVESDEPCTKELHNVPEPIGTSHTSAPSPSQHVIASPGTLSDSQSSGTYRTRNRGAVIRPAPFAE